MSRIIQRLQSYLAGKPTADERLSDLIIELRLRGINFHIEPVVENGKTYYVAESVDYPRGTIMTNAGSPEELNSMLKDAIFAAFDVPSSYCNPDIINIQTSLPIQESKQVYATT